MDSRSSVISLDGVEIDLEPRHRAGGIYKKGIDSQTLNSKNIKHTFSVNDVTLPGNVSAEESGPPSPQSGPPANFGKVDNGIWRSSFPQNSNIQFLESLKLRTIVTLVGTEFTSDFHDFVRRGEIQHYRIKIPPHKCKEDEIPIQNIAQVMQILLNPRNAPVLIHCNKGKHRTGCMTACYRKIQGMDGKQWGLDAILTEYHKYADPKARAYDEAFISAFKPEIALDAIAIMDRAIKPEVNLDCLKTLKESTDKVPSTAEEIQMPSAHADMEKRKRELQEKLQAKSVPAIPYNGLDPHLLTNALNQLSLGDPRVTLPLEADVLTPPDTESDDSTTNSPLCRYD